MMTMRRRQGGDGGRRLRAKARGRSYTRRAARRGLTIAELLMSLASMALIGAATTALMHAVSYGTQYDKDLREIVVKAKTIDSRIGAAVRGSAKVLDRGANYLVLWTYDTDASGTPHLAEIRRVERDPATNQLNAYQAPVNLAPAANTEYALADDFGAITDALKGGVTFPQTVWATGVTDWTIDLDSVVDQDARLVSYRFTVEAGSLDDVAVGAAALRN